jgi:hypothetical protein
MTKLITVAKTFNVAFINVISNTIIINAPVSRVICIVIHCK